MSIKEEAVSLEKARSLYQKQMIKEALMLLEDHLQKYPNSVEAYFISGNIFHLQGQLGKAIKAFRKVLELDPKHTDAGISLSVILNDIGKYEEAAKVFETTNNKVHQADLRKSDPHINRQFSLKHYELAEMYYVYDRFDESLFEYNKALALDPDNLSIRIKIAKVYSKKGFVSKAIEELKKLKSEYPGHIPARMSLGLLFYGQGKVIEAQSEWKNALLKEPGHEQALMYLKLSQGATETTL